MIILQRVCVCVCVICVKYVRNYVDVYVCTSHRGGRSHYTAAGVLRLYCCCWLYTILQAFVRTLGSSLACLLVFMIALSAVSLVTT